MSILIKILKILGLLFILVACNGGGNRLCKPGKCWDECMGKFGVGGDCVEERCQCYNDSGIPDILPDLVDTEPNECIDNDRDGYGVNCLKGEDCDDSDPDNWVSCETCADNDRDNYYINCDAYNIHHGPDCNDSDPLCYNDCSDDDGDHICKDSDCYSMNGSISSCCFLCEFRYIDSTYSIAPTKFLNDGEMWYGIYTLYTSNLAKSLIARWESEWEPDVQFQKLYYGQNDVTIAPITGVISEDGNIIVEAVYVENGNGDILIMKLDKESGNIIWAKSLNYTQEDNIGGDTVYYLDIVHLGRGKYLVPVFSGSSQNNGDSWFFVITQSGVIESKKLISLNTDGSKQIITIKRLSDGDFVVILFVTGSRGNGNGLYLLRISDILSDSPYIVWGKKLLNVTLPLFIPQSNPLIELIDNNILLGVNLFDLVSTMIRPGLFLIHGLTGNIIKLILVHLAGMTPNMYNLYLSGVMLSDLNNPVIYGYMVNMDHDFLDGSFLLSMDSSINLFENYYYEHPRKHLHIWSIDKLSQRQWISIGTIDSDDFTSSDDHIFISNLNPDFCNNWYGNREIDITSDQLHQEDIPRDFLRIEDATMVSEKNMVGNVYFTNVNNIELLGCDNY